MGGFSSFQIILLIFQYFLIGLEVGVEARSWDEGNSGILNNSQVPPPETENLFPFISFSEDGETIVEPELTYVEQGFSENLQTCQRTFSLLEGQTMQFRSPSNYSSSPGLHDMTSVTCFNSPPGTGISLTCEDFSVACGEKDYFEVSFPEETGPWMDNDICGNDITPERMSESNQMKIIFIRGGMRNGSKGSSHSPSRFSCRVSQIGSGGTPEVVPQLRNGGCNCGQRNGQQRIVGGVVAQPNEFPWRCHMRFGGIFCGCSLISNRWVMTAAHCTQGRGQANIVLGDHIRGRGGARVMTVTSRRVINHPSYIHRRSLSNDISLIELSSPVTFSREISPVCLPWNMATQTFAGTTAVTSGWGMTSGSSHPSGTPTLRKVNLPVVSNQECNNRAYRNRNASDMICGFQSGRGTCGGDSGGSMDLVRNSRHYAIGITSWGDEACRSYSVFARVTHFLDWIQTTTGEDFCRI